MRIARGSLALLAALLSLGGAVGQAADIPSEIGMVEGGVETFRTNVNGDTNWGYKDSTTFSLFREVPEFKYGVGDAHLDPVKMPAGGWQAGPNPWHNLPGPGQSENGELGEFVTRIHETGTLDFGVRGVLSNDGGQPLLQEVTIGGTTPESGLKHVLHLEGLLPSTDPLEVELLIRLAGMCEVILGGDETVVGGPSFGDVQVALGLANTVQLTDPEGTPLTTPMPGVALQGQFTFGSDGWDIDELPSFPGNTVTVSEENRNGWNGLGLLHEVSLEIPVSVVLSPHPGGMLSVPFDVLADASSLMVIDGRQAGPVSLIAALDSTSTYSISVTSLTPGVTVQLVGSGSTVIPEPSSLGVWCVLAACAAGAGWWRRRRGRP